MPDQYPSGTYLGFDYGQKFIGLAVGQSISKSASALQVIRVSNNSQWNEIEKQINEWQPVGLIVGFPETADGKTTAVHKHINRFIQELKTRYQRNVYRINEHLSSYAASDLPLATTKRKIPRLDDMAAAMILQTWFDENL